MKTKQLALDALKRQLAWHEDRKKELSKSGRSHAAIGWEMLQHSEEIDELTIIIASLEADIAAKVELVACRSDGRCQYAIDHGAEGLGHCPTGKCCMPPQQTEELSGYDLAKKVYEDLDRKCCPGVYLQLAVESIVKHSAAPRPAL